MLKRDNIQIFANATVKFGVPHSSMLNYSFFESKDVIVPKNSYIDGVGDYKSSCVCEGSHREERSRRDKIAGIIYTNK